VRAAAITSFASTPIPFIISFLAFVFLQKGNGVPSTMATRRDGFVFAPETNDGRFISNDLTGLFLFRLPSACSHAASD
jgi:hypothetical protein